MSTPDAPHRAELVLGAYPDSARRGLAAPRLGRLGEVLAATHLTEVDGLEVVARNWRVRCEDLVGELDLVARDGEGTLIVVEVKTRRDAGRFGGALAAAGATKGRRVRRLAGAFVSEGGWRAAAVRLDLVAIDVVGHRARLEHVMDAW